MTPTLYISTSIPAPDLTFTVHRWAKTPLQADCFLSTPTWRSPGTETPAAGPGGGPPPHVRGRSARGPQGSGPGRAARHGPGCPGSRQSRGGPRSSWSLPDGNWSRTTETGCVDRESPGGGSTEALTDHILQDYCRLRLLFFTFSYLGDTFFQSK